MVNANSVANIHEQLVQMSNMYGITQIETAIRQYLAELEEDKQDSQIGETAWNKFVSEGKEGRPLAELAKELNV